MTKDELGTWLEEVNVTGRTGYDSLLVAARRAGAEPQDPVFRAKHRSRLTADDAVHMVIERALNSERFAEIDPAEGGSWLALSLQSIMFSFRRSERNAVKTQEGWSRVNNLEPGIVGKRTPVPCSEDGEVVGNFTEKIVTLPEGHRGRGWLPILSDKFDVEHVYQTLERGSGHGDSPAEKKLKRLLASVGGPIKTTPNNLPAAKWCAFCDAKLPARGSDQRLVCRCGVAYPKFSTAQTWRRAISEAIEDAPGLDRLAAYAVAWLAIEYAPRRIHWDKVIAGLTAGLTKSDS